MNPLKFAELDSQTFAEAVRDKVDVVELEDLTGKVPHVGYGGALKSKYVSPKTGRTIYVLEQSGMYDIDAYINKVWQFDRDFTVEEAAEFLKRYEQSKNAPVEVPSFATSSRENAMKKVSTYTVNEQGLSEIRDFLAANHKKGADYFNRDMLLAWAADAEFQLSEGNSAIIEIRADDCIHGHTMEYRISDAGLDVHENLEEDPRFTRDNGDGTTTCGNHRLIVTLPTAEFEKIGRYGVFNDAMRMLANKSEAVLLQAESVSLEQIMGLAREMLIGDYLAEHGHYNLGETLMRLNGGHRMSPGMSDDVARARAYADGILDPITTKQLQEWASNFFATHGFTSDADNKFRREAAIEKLRAGIGVDRDAAKVLASAAETLERDRAWDIERRSAIGQTCRGWKIEIVGEMPEQVGLCRYRRDDEKKSRTKAPAPGM